MARDTTRNLRLFAFVVKHATDRRDKVEFDQYRPYVTMMKARALSAEAMDRDDHGAALKAAIDEGIEGIRAFLREYDQDEDQVQCRELGKLLRIRREIEQSRPKSARSSAWSSSSTWPSRSKITRKPRGSATRSPGSGTTSSRPAEAKTARKLLNPIPGIGLEARADPGYHDLVGFGRTESSAMFDRGVLLANQ